MNKNVYRNYVASAPMCACVADATEIAEPRNASERAEEPNGGEKKRSGEKLSIAEAIVPIEGQLCCEHLPRGSAPAPN